MRTVGWCSAPLRSRTVPCGCARTLRSEQGAGRESPSWRSSCAGLVRGRSPGNISGCGTRSRTLKAQRSTRRCGRPSPARDQSEGLTLRLLSMLRLTIRRRPSLRRGGFLTGRSGCNWLIVGRVWNGCRIGSGNCSERGAGAGRRADRHGSVPVAELAWRRHGVAPVLRRCLLDAGRRCHFGGLRHGNQPELNAAVAAARWSSSGEAGQRVLSRKDPRCRRWLLPRWRCTRCCQCVKAAGGWSGSDGRDGAL
jgi:hypothetical protein